MIEALYCHIPFCHRICPFCAFAVHGNQQRLHGPYLEALKAEIALRARRYRAALAPIRALYVGGGTPSTLSLPEVADLLGCLRRHFDFAGDAETAFELNPEDATPAYVEGLAALGINRFSLGLQSLDDATLRALGRNNGAEQGRLAVDALRRDGAANFNLELMFGAPRRPASAFRDDVQAASAYRAPHLSLYGLDVEPGTLFARNRAVCDWAVAHKDRQAQLYLWAADYLKARGYRHYEVSNFCRDGRAGRQNLIVWEGGNYLGFGLGAHSHVDGSRFHNERHLRAYLRRVSAGRPPTAFEERLSPVQRANEMLLLALRRDTGLHIAAWEEQYGGRWDGHRAALAARLVSEGKARLQDGRFALTTAGFLLADEITGALALP